MDGYQFQLGSLQGKTKDGIIKMIETLDKYDTHHNLFQSIIDFYIFQLLDNHSEFHPRTGRGNPNGCKECVLSIYNTFHTKKAGDWTNSVSNWVSRRKTRGKFVSLLNSFDDDDSLKLSIYFDGTLEDFYSGLELYEEILKQGGDVYVDAKLERLWKTINK